MLNGSTIMDSGEDEAFQILPDSPYSRYSSHPRYSYCNGHFLRRTSDCRGIQPDSSTCIPLLQGCVDRKTLPEGKLLQAHMVERGFTPDVFLATKLVIMYTKCGSLVDARQVFDEMP